MKILNIDAQVRNYDTIVTITNSERDYRLVSICKQQQIFGGKIFSHCLQIEQTHQMFW